MEEEQKNKLVQQYAQLCSQLGEKTYQREKLAKEVERLMMQVEHVQAAFHVLHTPENKEIQKAPEGEVKNATN